MSVVSTKRHDPSTYKTIRSSPNEEYVVFPLLGKLSNHIYYPPPPFFVICGYHITVMHKPTTHTHIYLFTLFIICNFGIINIVDIQPLGNNKPNFTR